MGTAKTLTCDFCGQQRDTLVVNERPLERGLAWCDFDECSAKARAAITGEGETE
jgi:hypothetical protein